MRELSRVLTAFYSAPWAIRPETLAVMQAVVQRWAAGVKLSADELQAAVGDAPQAAAERQARSAGVGAVAVIPIHGILSHRIHMVQDISGPGGTSTERVARQLRTALADPSVGAIVLDVDSPGGMVYGVQELADEIFEARAQKKIVAVASPQAASAGYWIARAAEELVVTPSGEVGSVGVFGAHEDWSKFLELKGVKMSLVHAGKYKVEGNPYEALGDEARGAMQASVERYHGDFVRGLARYTAKSVDDVRKNFGEGRVLRGDDAVKAGMADRVDTLDATITRLARSPRAQKPKSRDAAKLRLAELT